MVSGTYPDGSEIPTTSNSSSYSASITASVSTEGVDISDMVDQGLGNLVFSNEIDWNCGESSYGGSSGKVGISRRTFEFSSMVGGQCVYTLNCPPGQTPTCSTSTFNRSPPCFETYVNDTSLYVRSPKGLLCFGVGNAKNSYTQGTCD